MNILELVLSYVVGALVALLLSAVFSLKTKGIIRLLINLVAGCVALLVLSLLKVPYFKLNPASAFIVGFTGLPGIFIIYLIGAFL